MNDSMLPQPGQYTDGLGRVLLPRPSRRASSVPKGPQTMTERFVLAIVSRQVGKGGRASDGGLDRKAVQELLPIAAAEGLLERDAQGRVREMDRLLEVLRPFARDLTTSGAHALLALMAEAGVRPAEFFGPTNRDPRAVDPAETRARRARLLRLG